MQTTKDERNVLAERAKKLKRTKLLAEKVETWEEFEDAKSLGFEYFQGYYFCRPVVLTSREIPHNPFTSFTELYLELNRDEPDMDKLARIIENDVSLSYALLKVTNTPPFITRHKVRTIKQALMLLGIEEMRKMIYLLSMKRHISHPTMEPLRVSLIRAKLCERLARLKSGVYRPGECFLIGLLSMIDVLLGMPMEEVLRNLPLSDHIADTLLGKTDWPEHALFQCAILLEKGSVEEAYKGIAPLDEPMEALYRSYVEAVSWADQVFPYVSA